MRISDHPVLGPRPEPSAEFSFNGVTYPCRVGEPIAAALLANGIRALRSSPSGTPRGLYCGIGHCYECRIWLSSGQQVRACIHPVAEGLTCSSEPAQ